MQGGDAHMKSNSPFLNFPTSFLTSDKISGFDFGFMSTVVDVCPIFLATLEKDCVPEHNSKHLILETTIKIYAKLLTSNKSSFKSGKADECSWNIQVSLYRKVILAVMGSSSPSHFHVMNAVFR